MELDFFKSLPSLWLGYCVEGIFSRFCFILKYSYNNNWVFIELYLKHDQLFHIPFIGHSLSWLMKLNGVRFLQKIAVMVVKILCCCYFFFSRLCFTLKYSDLNMLSCKLRSTICDFILFHSKQYASVENNTTTEIHYCYCYEQKFGFTDVRST